VRPTIVGGIAAGTDTAGASPAALLCFDGSDGAAAAIARAAVVLATRTESC